MQRQHVTLPRLQRRFESGRSLVRDTNTIGAMTEGHVLAALLSAGYTVAIPFGVARYDLLLDRSGKIERVQCKTGRLRNGCVLFNTTSNREEGRTGYRGQIEYFGIFCRANGKVYLVPEQLCSPKSEARLRIDPTTRDVKLWAKDYEVHARVDTEGSIQLPVLEIHARVA